MAGVDESRKERQIDEVEVLKAVYMDAFTDLRHEDVWKVYRPPEISLHLVPLHSMHGEAVVHAHIDLIVKCTGKYPDEIPTLKLENAKGLSNDIISMLRWELVKLAKELVGEVMIYDLAQFVQNYLEPFNKPGPKSFYEEMMTNKRKQEEEIAREEQKKLDIQKRREEKENEMIEVEIQKRQEELREDTRRRKEARKEMNAEEEPLSTSPITPVSILRDNEMKSRSNTRSPKRTRKDSLNERRRSSTPARDPSEESSADSQSHRRNSLVYFENRERCVRMARCLGSNAARGCLVHLGMDTTSGDLVTITEWTLKWRHVNRASTEASAKEYVEREVQKYVKQIVNIQHELQSLVKLDHPNLIKYISMTHTVEQSTIVVYVLKEYVNGGSVEMHINNTVPLPCDLLRYYTKSLLEALCYLHDKAVTHKDLRASSVFFDDKGCVRLGDYSLDKRMSGLYECVESARSGVQFTGLEDGRPQTLGRSAKKADVYQMGLLMLSLAMGARLTEMLPDIPSTLPPDLRDFIQQCLSKDEKSRWSTNQLLDHEFIKPSLRTDQRLLAFKKPEPEPVQAKKMIDLDLQDDFNFVSIATDSQGQSRLTREFEVLEWLGKGGFGDVLKVRNNLDGRCYAMKRILLNPKSKQFNKKITREVKLLSRLNHENVVRYYYSWIETSVEPVIEETDSSSQTTPNTSSESAKKPDIRRNSIGILDSIEVSPVGMEASEVEWSISEDVPQFHLSETSSSESESEDDDDVVFGSSFSAMFEPEEESFGVVFEHNDDNPEASEQVTDSNAALTESQPEPIRRAQFLYIQMEFCEKSTLKHCIEAGLYNDRNRVWRLFREIIEGLDHIHEQGMIHRDLKPFNVFLDSNDHVKIGDFGLATTSIVVANKKVRQQQNLADTSILSLDASQSRSADLECDLTGKVGTSLYVAPEIMHFSGRGNYTQKVDIYSLGIIFFEMCYHPLVTGMERVKILTNLRKPGIQLSDDFDIVEMENQTEIIRWLLQHDPNKRPSSKELLQSPFLPPPLMEEAELTEILRSTISNPQSKAYKRMVSAMFNQPVAAAADYTYDIALFRGSYSVQQGLQIDHVHQLLIQVFEKHGAVQLKSPLLMPKNTLYDHSDQYSCFMDRSGGLVSLPYDLRTPFARFVARNNVTSLKRFCIQNVFREKKLYGIHPGQPTEAAFDIVTQTPGSLISDAELIHVVKDVIEQFPSLQRKNYYVRINHLALLKGILLYCGVKEDLHIHVIRVMNDTKAVVHKDMERYNRLSDLGISDSSINTLNNFVSLEGPFDKIEQKLICITKTKGQAGSMVKKGLHELKTIMSHVENMGSKFQWILMFMPVSNVGLYCGMMFQVVSKIEKKNDKFMLDILAVGGRYDGLVAKFRRRSLHGNPQSAAGVSISVDKILTCLGDEFQENSSMDSHADVIICSVGHKMVIKDQLVLASKLWAAGVRALINYDQTQSLEEIQEQCLKQRIKHLAVLKDQESGYVKVQVIERDRTVEKKVSVSEAVDFLQKRSSSADQNENRESKSSSNLSSLSISSDTHSQSSNQSHPTNQSSLFITTFIQDDTKLSSSVRRKYEAQMYPKIINVLKMLSPKLRLEVLGLDLCGQKDSLLKNISGFLDLDNDQNCFQSSVSMILEKHQRYRRYLGKVFDTIHSLRYNAKEGKCPPILLYALKDDCYKLIICCS